MIPQSSVIVPILTTTGVPSNSFGKDGQYCYSGDTGIMYGPKNNGVWPPGLRLLDNVTQGTTLGQLFSWNGSALAPVAVNNLFWDDTTKRIGAYSGFKVLNNTGGIVDQNNNAIIYYSIPLSETHISAPYSNGVVLIKSSGNNVAKFSAGYVELFRQSSTQTRLVSKISFSTPVTTDATRTGRIVITVSDYAEERTAFQADANGTTITAQVVGQTLFTEFGGIARKVINKTGSASVKGSLVVPSPTTNNGVALAVDAYDAIGFIYDSGVADGGECWMVYSGVAEALAENNKAVTRGEFVRSTNIAGRVTTSTIPNPPTSDTHFKECGHAIESKASGTNVLFKLQIHFL